MMKIEKPINALTLVCLAITFMVGCKTYAQSKTDTTDKMEYVESSSGLRYKVLKQGVGEVAENGDEVLLFETTSYRNGTELYSNENATNPLKIKLGANMVTKGVEEGLHGMRSGEIRELIVPPYLAKRTVYPENVSPDSTLVIKLIVDKVIKAH